MDDAEFEELLALRHEVQGVEFKGPGARTEKPFAALVLRACLAMANHRDGGIVVLGVGEGGNKHLNPIGLSEQQSATWNYDDLSDLLAEYADPSVSFDVEPFHYKGNDFSIITVREFEDVPVLCRKEYLDHATNKQILRKGACYVRPRRKPQSSEIATSEDMRDLLDLATDKGIRRHIARNRAVGLLDVPKPEPSDDENYDAQLRDILG